ncbi:hypothetical protein SAVIM338S_04027 [Streptomyces avidinii]
MARVETATGGRDATTGVIAGRWALSVGDPKTPTAPGFHWVRLSDIARLESGHTPSRRKPEYWDGGIPWVGIKDATGNHGRTITSTLQSVTEAGIANSSARILPAGTVCLSRTASVGYVITMGVEMATSQDFVNWVCGPAISPKYLHYILVSEQESVRRFAHGTTHQTVYYPEAKAFHVCIPERVEQDAIAGVLGALDEKIAVNERIADVADELCRSMFSEQRSDARTTVEAIATLRKEQVSPAVLTEASVAHFSLPAFDSGKMPELTSPLAIKSAKFVVREPAVLLSKLNPEIPRVWNAAPKPGIPALASTEFLVLEPKSGVTTAELWAVLSQPGLLSSLAARVTGTSKSHQRVRPAEVMSSEIVDPRKLGPTRGQAQSLAQRTARARNESHTLAALRDTLLPQLMSGKLRVRDAERIVEDAV